MSQLHLSLLGPPEIRHQEQILKFRTRKELALLIYLAVEGGMHSREKLIALFWPDFDEVRGRTILRRTLALLREVLEEATAASDETHLVVERNALGIRHISSVVSDFCLLNAAFTRVHPQPSLSTVQGEERGVLVSQLQNALHPVRGIFLEDFSLPDAPAFDTWMNTQREAIRRRLCVLFDALSSLQMESGEISAAIATATRWTTYDPVDEAATRRLMQLYFIAGKRDEALRVYETARTWLKRELSVEPASETMALAERLRREQPPREQSLPQISVSSVYLESPLIGRAKEYASLVERYHQVQRQETNLVLVEGGAGIGKTRLVTDFLKWTAAQGADVLHGRAFMNGSHIAYQPVVDALRRRIEQENAPEDLLSDIWLSELSRILPELRDRYPDLPPPFADGAIGQMRLFEAVARLGQAWAMRRPLVLFFDDLQWADVSSRDLISYALQQWRESKLPVLLIVNVRSEALLMTPGLQEWLLSLKHVASTLALTLDALRYEDLMQWMQYLNAHALHQGGEKMVTKKTDFASVNGIPFANWLFNRTQGQPLYVEELIKALLERQMLRAIRCSDETWAIDTSVTTSEVAQWHLIMPSRIHDTIRMRLTHITPVSRILLSAASVLGHDFTYEQLRQVAELQDNDALQALDGVLCHRLLVEQINKKSSSGEVTYSFSHDTLREVVYIETGESRRRVFERRASQLQSRHVTRAGLSFQKAHYETIA